MCLASFIQRVCFYRYNFYNLQTIKNKIIIRYEISINAKWMVGTRHNTVRFKILNIRILQALGLMYEKKTRR